MVVLLGLCAAWSTYNLFRLVPLVVECRGGIKICVWFLLVLLSLLLGVCIEEIRRLL